MKSVVFAIAGALTSACDTPDDMLPIQPTSGNVIGKGEPGDPDPTVDAGTGLGDGGLDDGGLNDGGFGELDSGFEPLDAGFDPLDAGTGGTDQIPDDQTDQIP